MKNKFILYCLLLSYFTIYPQNTDWINYTNGDNIYSITSDKNDILVGTNGGGFIMIGRIMAT